jgi:hypothetical protein
MFLTAFLSWVLFGLEINYGFLAALVVCGGTIYIEPVDAKTLTQCPDIFLGVPMFFP